MQTNILIGKAILLLGLIILNFQVVAQDYYNSKEFKEFEKTRKSYKNANSAVIDSFIGEWEEKALKSGDSIAIAYVWMTGNQLNRLSGNYQRAKAYGFKAMRIIEGKSLKGKFTYNKRFLAAVLVSLGDYQEGISLALQSIDEFEKEDPYQNQYNYHILADGYLSLHNYERMDYYLQKWYELVKEKNIRMDLGFAIYNMHELYDIAKMYDKASFYQNEFYKFYAESGSEIEHIPEHAFITVTGESPEIVIDKLMNYLPYHIENDRKNFISQTYLHLGLLYLETGKPKKALANFQNVVKFNELDGIENQISTYQGLAEAYSLNGNYKSAFEASKKQMSLLDSFQNETILKQANELEAKYENEKNVIQLEHKDDQIKAKNRWLLLSVITGVLFFAIAVFIYFLYKKLGKSNSALNKTISEKETLLQEIHHRVKNNLQVISSLLSLQSKYVKDKNAVSALSEGQNRVESMALIHQNLYREDNITGVNVKSYIPLLAQNIFDNYNIHGDRVKVEFNVDDITLDVASVIPIGLVLNELISNALKYAFPNERKGLLNIIFKEKGDTLLLQVIDNGIGIKENEGEAGFGTKLIHSFTRKLEGELKITTHKGTKVELIINKFQRA